MPHPFPDDFTWGVATSSYQIEGAVHADGRGESIWDRFTHTPGAIQDGSTGDTACDHYHRWPDDVALMQRLGIDAYAFSIAWPRVLPQGTGPVNDAGLDFYDRLVDGLLEAGITPLAKLYHWDLPQILEDAGGWANRATADAFAAYADVTARRLGDRVAWWMTHNEPWCTVFLGYWLGMFAPGVRNFKTALQTSHHVLLSHGLAVPVIRAAVGEKALVGIGLNLTVAQPATDSAEDTAAARRHDGFFNRWFLDPITGRGYPADMWALYEDATPAMQDGDLNIIAAPLDYLGVNFYDATTIAHAPDAGPLQTRHVAKPDQPRTADREIHPEALYALLDRLHTDYDFPAYYIAENGSAWPDELSADGQIHDAGRVAFIQAHFAQAARALAAGIPLRGYFVWSLLDNFEWAAGYTLRYGIAYTDYTTQQRIPKDSFLWYQDFLAGRAALPGA